MVTTPTQFFPRRKYVRKAYSGRAVVFCDKQTAVSETVQISEGGMLLLTSLDMDIGQEVTVHFTISRHYLRVRAEVIYKLENSADTNKMKIGLRFPNLPYIDQTVIREFTGQKPGPL